MTEWETPRGGGWKAVLAALLVVAVTVGAIGVIAASRPQAGGMDWMAGLPEGDRSRHDISVVVSQEGRSAGVVQAVTYRNASETPLSEIWFALYPNAYRSEETAPFEEDEFYAAYPEGFSSGGVERLRVSVNGEPLSLEPEGPADIHLRVPLSVPLEPGGEAEISFEYDLILPRCDGRFGYSDAEIRLCNAFAAPMPLINGSWLLYPYGPIGDPFVTEAADYRVSITADARYRLAATGYDAAQPPTSEPRVFSVNGVRDVAAVLSLAPSVSGTEWRGVRVSALAATPQQADKTLDIATESLRVFWDTYGPYPYGTFTVAASDFFIGGMEYPGLVLIDRSIYTGQAEMMEYIIVHEVAHQWWYAVVGNDQCLHPWLDETLASHSTMTYYLNRYGRMRYETMMDGYVVPGASWVYSAMFDLPPVGAPSDAFWDNMEYSAVVYDYGTLIFEQARSAFGDEMLNRALARYYEENMLRIASPADFFSAMEMEGSKELSTMLRRSLIYGANPFE